MRNRVLSPIVEMSFVFPEPPALQGIPMPRPPLQVGTWGKISRDQVQPGAWRAMARFRDFDGATRQVEARGATGANAERQLISAMTDRAMPAGEYITADTRISGVGGRVFGS